MKKSQELSRKTWKMIAKNLIILAVLIVVAFVGTMSWFTKGTKAEANGINVKTEAPDGLEYYIVAPSDSDQYQDIETKLAKKGEAWHTGPVTIDATNSEFKFMEDLFLCEVTGDGKTFNIPKLLQFGEVAYVDNSSDFEEAVANENYMSFDIYFRTNSQHTVTLKSGSSIAPVGDITDDEEGIKNAAIGAVRMSVVNGSNRQLLWIPAPCIWYDSLGDKDELITGLSGSDFLNKGTVAYDSATDSLMYTGEATTDHAYYDLSKNRQIITSSNVGEGSLVASTSGNYQLGEDTSIVTLDKTSGSYHYGYVRVNLWIEGEDAEARLKFVGGKFDMALKFGLV